MAKGKNNDKLTKNKNEKLIIILLTLIVILLGIILIMVLLKKDDTNNLLDNNDSNYQEIIPDENINEDTSNNSSKNISRDAAINIALQDIKLSRSEVYDLDVELEKKFNQTVYEVTFDYKNLEYEYYINVETGNIAHSFKEID